MTDKTVQFNQFVGLDISSQSFDVCMITCPVGEQSISLKTEVFANDRKGYQDFYKSFNPQNAFLVLEFTGGYELGLLSFLCGKGANVHRADGRKVLAFKRSFGTKAKTDRIDAQGLAEYGRDRHDQLPIYQPPSQEQEYLRQLADRRHDLKQMVVQEKNRLQAPGASARVKKSVCTVIKTLEAQIKAITQEAQEWVDKHSHLQEKVKALQEIAGIGAITALNLVVLLPELGMIDNKKIASLGGLAPYSRDSGKHQGYRKTGYGRTHVKPVLFMAAMAARRSNSDLADFYNALIARGKKKMVALTALMRKILVRANAKIRDLNLKEKHG